MEGHSTLKAFGRVTAIVLIGILFLFPLYWMITMSFKPQSEWNPIGKTIWWPQNPTLDNYKQVLGLTNQNTQFFQASSTDATQPIIHSFIAAGGGTILCIASTTALHPRVNLGAYCVSKAGVGMLVRVLGREVAKDSIRVVGVCPTGVETPLLAGMIEGLRQGDTSKDQHGGLMASKPVQRWLGADEVAESILWLSSPAANAVTGSNIPIDFASA